MLIYYSGCVVKGWLQWIAFKVYEIVTFVLKIIIDNILIPLWLYLIEPFINYVIIPLYRLLVKTLELLC